MSVSARIVAQLEDREPTLSAPVEAFYEDIREPGYPAEHFRHEDDDQYVGLRVDAADLERKGKRALQILLALLAFVAIAGLVGASDRETLRQQSVTRLEP